MLEVLLTRQAIFDARLQVAAYVLESSFSGTEDQGTQASDQVLGTLADMGVEHLASEHPAYVTCAPEATEAFVDFCSSVPHFGLHITFDPVRIEEIRDAAWLCAQRGTGLVLSFPGPEKADKAPLAQADMALLSAPEPDPAALRKWADILSGYRAHAGARDIATDAVFKAAREAGCKRFQGGFLAESSRWEGNQIPRGMISPMSVLARLQSDDVSVREIEKIVRSDAMLSYRLLRWVNSAYYGIGIEVDNIEHAIVYLGVEQLRRWLSLMSMSNLRPASPELLTMAAIRGRMAELLAPRTGLDPSKAFTLGLFSLLDAITRTPMDQILAALPLSSETVAAILTGRGSYGQLLTTIKDYEQGHWQRLRAEREDVESLGETYLKAVEWANAQQLPQEATPQKAASHR